MPFFFNNFIIRSRNEDGDQSGAQEDSGRIPACATRMRRMQQINHRQVKGIFNSAIFNTAMRLICAGICWERWTCSGTKIASNADAATVDWGRSDRHSTPEPIWFCAAETISGNHADISLLHTTHAHTHAHTHTHTHTHLALSQSIWFNSINSKTFPWTRTHLDGLLLITEEENVQANDVNRYRSISNRYWIEVLD